MAVIIVYSVVIGSESSCSPFKADWNPKTFISLLFPSPGKRSVDSVWNQSGHKSFTPMTGISHTIIALGVSLIFFFLRLLAGAVIIVPLNTSSFKKCMLVCASRDTQRGNECTRVFCGLYILSDTEDQCVLLDGYYK